MYEVTFVVSQEYREYLGYEYKPVCVLSTPTHCYHVSCVGDIV